MTNPSYDIAYEATRYGDTLRGAHFVEFVDIATIDHHRARIVHAKVNLTNTLRHLSELRARKVQEGLGRMQDPLWEETA